MAKSRRESEEELADGKPSHEAIARAIQQLSPEEAQFFLTKLEATLKKRKRQLTGYLVAAGLWLVAMIGALYYDGLTDGFVGWVYLIPFALVGVSLWVFGRWAERAV